MILKLSAACLRAERSWKFPFTPKVVETNTRSFDCGFASRCEAKFSLRMTE